MRRASVLWLIAFSSMWIIAGRPAHTGAIHYDIEEIPTLGGA